jgi:predicted unusual protein kinase regulating ubiquinone biosynthesis (AarF/ABC1/UbiB family)
MGGFLPRVYSKELEQLQDQVPPHPFSALSDALFESFHKAPEELFRDIEREPLAAASLGQVHVAHLKDGRKVAVKFLYPGIRGVIAVDMRVVRLMVAVYSWFVPVAKLERVHESLVDLLRRETDYLHEAACMVRMAKNFAGDAGLAFPAPIHELTTRDVLTMTFMEGVKITKLDELRAAGVDPSGVALRLVQSFYKMLFVDRFFHADPHPGNFLVEPQKGGAFRLVVLDFGAICVAKDSLIDGLIEILQGFFAQNDEQVVRGFRQMGFVAPGGNDALMERTVKAYFQKLLKLSDRTASALMRATPDQLERLANPETTRGELQELMRSVEYPEDWFYVERACVVLFWLAAQIDPKLDTLQAGFPYVMPLLLQRAAEQAAKSA